MVVGHFRGVYNDDKMRHMSRVSSILEMKVCWQSLEINNDFSDIYRGKKYIMISL